MQIDHVRVYGLDDSIVASGFPMLETYSAVKFENELDMLGRYKDYMTCVDMRTVPAVDLSADERERAERHLTRAEKLGSCAGGESHDCYLCGIVVQFNMTAPRYFWPEFARYHFADIVSSTSTMHRLKAFVKHILETEDAGDMNAVAELMDAHFTPETRGDVIHSFLAVAAGMYKSNKWNIETLKANLPEGWLQTARVTTNYRQLRTIKRQRKNHPLQQWKDFCAWIETLPMMDELLTVGDNLNK